MMTFLQQNNKYHTTVTIHILNFNKHFKIILKQMFLLVMIVKTKLFKQL